MVSSHRASTKKRSSHHKSKPKQKAKSHPRSRSRTKSIKKSRRKSSAGYPVENFHCMSCKMKSPSQVERYEKTSRGGTMARARCNKCDTKMCLMVKKRA